MPHHGSYRYHDKPQQGRKTLRRLITYVGYNRTLLGVIGGLILLNIACNLLGSYLLRPIINEYILPGNFLGLGGALGVLGAVYLMGVSALYIQYRLLNKVGQRTVARLRAELFEHMERLPVPYFDTHQHGDLMSRYTNDIDRVSEALTDSLSEMLSSALMLVGVFGMMLYISPILTLVSLVTLPLMFGLARAIVRRSRRRFAAQQAVLGRVNGYIEEIISAQRVVKLFGHERQAIDDFDHLNRQLKEQSRLAQFYAGMMMPAMQNLNTLNSVMVTVVGGLLALFRGFDVGGLAAFLQYSRQFGRPINELSVLYNNIQAAIAGAERIFQVIDQDPESDSSDQMEASKVRGEVCFREVWFSYRPGKPVLKGISFQARPGSKIALVGATGAGKTTILNLLPRFFTADSGEITIDGIPVNRINRASLRRSMAIVLQDTHLFTGTVRENIRFGRLEATDEEVEQAARLTSAHSFIQRLPHGYDTLLENDGANLSQGQRQLLNIARAAVADPSILLLDEATSNIDTRSEMWIQQGLDQLMQGRTCLIIAHRLSTVCHADTILVLDEGRIVEQGTHVDLLRARGKYYELYREQFGVEAGEPALRSIAEDTFI